MRKRTIFFILPIFAILGVILGLFVYYNMSIGAKKPLTLPSQIVKQDQTLPPSATPIPDYSPPRKLIIPKLNINSNVEEVGLDNKGNMDIPKDDFNVAWYKLGFMPGQAGNAVLAGHLDRADGSPAVFYKLNSLEIGDQIYIEDQLGNKKEFKVVDKQVFEANDFPIERVFGASNKKQLNLITCEGVYDKSAHNYSQRTVIFTELIEN